MVTTRTNSAKHVNRLILACCVERLYDPEQTPSTNLRAKNRSDWLVHRSVLTCPFPSNNPCPKSPTRHGNDDSDITSSGPMVNLVANFPEPSVTEGS